MLELSRVVHALRESAGNRALAARLLGVDRSAITHFANRTPELAEEEAKIKQEWLDLCEAQLFARIRDGDGQLIKYYLDNHGGERGYGKKLGDPDRPLHTKVVKPDLAELVRGGKISREDLKTMKALRQKMEAATDGSPST